MTSATDRARIANAVKQSRDAESWEDRRKREDMERAEIKQHRQAMGHKIAALLPQGWTFEPDKGGNESCIGDLVAPSGEHSISLDAGRYGHPNHWCVSGNTKSGWNDYFANKEKPEGINIGLQKSPEQIAKDICRRFLPQWIEYAEKQIAYAQNVVDVRNKRERDILALVDSLNDPRIIVRREHSYDKTAKTEIKMLDYRTDEDEIGGGTIEIDCHSNAFTIKARNIDAATVLKMMNAIRPE